MPEALRPVRASAPGKLILMGEHAAVYGRPALVAAVDRRLTVDLAPRVDAQRSEPTVHLVVPGLGLDLEVAWERILAVGETARRAWERYDANPGPETFTALRGGGAERLLVLALAEAAGSTGDGARATPHSPSLPSVTLRVDSSLPVGSGFGSSAAAAVAVILAWWAFRGEVDKDQGEDEPGGTLPESTLRRLHRLSLEVERRQHGHPSGVDNATVIRGGLLQARRLDDGGIDLQPVATGAASGEIFSRLRVVSTGPPTEGTGEVVAAVRSLRDREPARVEAALDAIDEATGALRRALEADDDRPLEVRDALRRCHAGLVDLGVVPEPVRRLVAAIEERGGAAKISGAGSVAGPGAGTLLVHHPEPDRLDGWAPLAELEPHPVTLGAPGARLEPVESVRAPDIPPPEEASP